MIRFRRLYTNPKEGEWIESLISYNKIPYLFQSYIYRTTDPITNIKNISTDDYKVIQYRYRLRIDLWILILEWHWEGKKDES